MRSTRLTSRTSYHQDLDAMAPGILSCPSQIGIRFLPEPILDRRFRSLARPPLHVSLLGRLSRPPPPSRYWLLRKRRNLLIQDRLSILVNLVFHSLVVLVVVAIIVWRKPVAQILAATFTQAGGIVCRRSIRHTECGADVGEAEFVREALDVLVAVFQAVFEHEVARWDCGAFECVVGLEEEFGKERGYDAAVDELPALQLPFLCASSFQGNRLVWWRFTATMAVTLTSVVSVGQTLLHAILMADTSSASTDSFCPVDTPSRWYRM
jgi:hypothetical protein